MAARAQLLEVPARGLRRLWPGCATCVLVALAASFVATQFHGPPMLYALLFGIALHHQSVEERAIPGIDFCSSSVLRLGVGLLGARIGWDQIASLGWPVVACVLGAVASTLACGWWVARWLRLPWTLGLLSGAATAICGASAALAVAAVLPRPGDGETPVERQALIVAVMATLLSTGAMLAYPLMAQALELPPARAGLFIGGSIHDVAQVVVAGYAMSTEAGDAASIVKLLRVSLLVVVVIGVSLLCRSMPAADTAGRSLAVRARGLVPGFLWLFVALAMLNSVGVLGACVDHLNAASRLCLMVGVAGLGTRTSFVQLAWAGWRPVLLMVASSAWIAAFMLALAAR
jgi:uncharacterized integral membrane protein (TIGR00698 family)